MLKKLLLFVALLAIAAIVALSLFGSSFVAKVVKTSVEQIGPKVTQTSVELNDVDLSILSGNLSLQGLYVGNPAGFTSEHIFALNQIDIDIEPRTILSDKLVINRIYIKQPEMSYEKTLSSSNIAKLQKSIEHFSSEGEDTAPQASSETTTEKSSSSKQIIIRELIIEDCKVFVGFMGAGTQVVIPRIVINDIGESGDERSLVDALNIVLAEVIKQVGGAASKSGEAAGDLSTGVLEGVKGLFGK